MIQIIVKNGKLLTDNIPAPAIGQKAIRIRVINSCISAGTEISVVAENSKSIIHKAIAQPEKVKKAFDMIKREGIGSLRNKISSISETILPLGYSIAGIIMDTGTNVTGFTSGDRVAASGAGYANHAEIVSVPANLVVKIGDNVSFRQASTVALGAIAMQGVRRIDARLGEYCTVIGTGILGLLAIQMLKASGIRVAAIDIDENRLLIAKLLGAEVVVNPVSDNPVNVVENWTHGFGTDSVLFTASTTSSEPLSQAFKMCKRKGKVVLVGVSGMTINREDIYAKEIDFQISTSYGPGRYDHTYEESCVDYPYSYVRWTENRNMSEYLRLVENGSVKLDDLISTVYPVEKASDAFELFKSSAKKPIIALLEYGTQDTDNPHDSHNSIPLHAYKGVMGKKKNISIALIGAGAFATGMHLPTIARLNDKFSLKAVMDMNGLAAKSAALKFGAAYATTDFNQIIADSDIDLVMITTRHKSHAELALKALKSGKNVFVEKPLAINNEQLESIESFYAMNTASPPLLMVGFNRRFSKYTAVIKRHTDKRISPLFIHYRMNAGYIPSDHWIHEDGGRIIGEGCHIIDLVSFLVGSRIKSISCNAMIPKTTKFSGSDNKSFILSYMDGSVATIEYFSVGSNLLPKEYLEVHFDEKTIIMNDYKSIKGYGLKIESVMSKTSEKGHLEELVALHETLSGKQTVWPIPLDSMLETTKTSFLLAD